MKSTDIRQAFIDYFVKHQHQAVPTSSLIPHNDPTLLFTNAGMVQFKDVFLGREHREYQRAVSSQRCVRAGGKHNDLDNVGYTARHHTFFEMLGNFSFGDYFKREAIHFAWHFLTKQLGLPAEKLWVTVYLDDREAENIWLQDIKIDKNRFSRCDKDSNFWSMGNIGPCGPCTEIFYDHGPSIAGGPPGSPDQDGDRYIEIWNLVFMQYDSSEDGSLSPLPKPSVDTGMGLERLSAVLQGVQNNYDTDLFIPIIEKAVAITRASDPSVASLKVLADHIRSTSFLICDGVVPSNEGRGYVLRRIIRRACRHGHHLGMDEPFFYQLVQPLVAIMGQAFPELQENAQRVEQVLRQEEEQFLRTLDQGMHILKQELKKLSGQVIPGALAFKLYDTYGFPLDLTADIAREKNLTVDTVGFDSHMEKQRDQSSQASHFRADYHDIENIEVCSDFVGYDSLQQTALIQALLIAGKRVESAQVGDEVIVVLDVTPFYAESGGQVGDSGRLTADNTMITIHDTQKQGDAILHYGHIVSGSVHNGMTVIAGVNADTREPTRLNHSATHLLHAALRQVLGGHVMQKGSAVAPSRLRFDFAHFQALSLEEMHQIETLVNAHIRLNHEVVTEVVSLKQAQKSGAMALFGEKYGDKVRVLSMGDFSKELCGGTHVKRTGDIGYFKIINEIGIAAGVRRIEALTGALAEAWSEHKVQQLKEVAALLKTDEENLLDRLQALLALQKQSERELQQLRLQAAQQSGSSLESQAISLGAVSLLVKQIDGIDIKTLRQLLDQVKSSLDNGVIVLATVNDMKVHLVAGVCQQATQFVSAIDLVNHIAKQIGGKGGGRVDMAQAGGSLPGNLPAALQSVESWVKQQIQA